MFTKKRKYKKKSHMPGMLATVTGTAINALAVELKAGDKTLTIDEAKNKAKGLIKASKTLERKAGNRPSWILQKLLGNFLGAQASKLLVGKRKESEAIELLANHKSDQQKANRIPDTEFREIIKRLGNIETQIKALKIVKVAAPPKVNVTGSAQTAQKVTPNTKEMSDARDGLTGLGYKKKTIDTMLQDAPEGASADELIKHALQDPSKRVPKAEVPAAVDTAKQEMATPGSGVLKEDEKIDAGKHDRSKQEHEEAFKKEMQKQLDEIKEGAEAAEDAAEGNSGTLGKILTIVTVELLPEILTIGLAVAAIALIVADIIKIVSIGKQISADLKNHKSDLYKATHGSDAQRKAANIKLDNFQKDRPWYAKGFNDKKAVSDYMNIKEKTVSGVEKGTHAVEGWFGKDSKKAVASKATSMDLAPPKPVTIPRNKDGSIDHTAMALDKVSREKEDLTSKKGAATLQPIIIKQPASPPIIAPQQKEVPTITLKTRNDESSYSAMVTDLFDHPQTHSMVRGL